MSIPDPAPVTIAVLPSTLKGTGSGAVAMLQLGKYRSLGPTCSTTGKIRKVSIYSRGPIEALLDAER